MAKRRPPLYKAKVSEKGSKMVTDFARFRSKSGGPVRISGFDPLFDRFSTPFSPVLTPKKGVQNRVKKGVQNRVKNGVKKGVKNGVKKGVKNGVKKWVPDPQKGGPETTFGPRILTKFSPNRFPGIPVPGTPGRYRFTILRIIFPWH